LADGCAHARKAAKQIPIVQQRFAKTGRRLEVVFANMTDNVGQIA